MMPLSPLTAIVLVVAANRTTSTVLLVEEAFFIHGPRPTGSPPHDSVFSSFFSSP